MEPCRLQRHWFCRSPLRDIFYKWHTLSQPIVFLLDTLMDVLISLTCLRGKTFRKEPHEQDFWKTKVESES